MKQLIDNGIVLVSQSNNTILTLDAYSTLLLEGTQLGLTAEELLDHSPEHLKRLFPHRSVTDIESLQADWHRAGFCVPPVPDGGFVVHIGTVPGVIKTNSPALGQLLDSCFDGLSPLDSDAAQTSLPCVHCWETTNPVGYGVQLNEEAVSWHSDIAQAVLEVVFLVSDAACLESERLAVLHAGGVERDGKVIILPAVAGSGKTTLTASLPSYGYRVLHDDILPVNPDLTLASLNYPLAIKSGSWSLLEPIYPELAKKPVLTRPNGISLKYLPLSGQQRVSVDTPLTANLIVQPQFDPDAEPGFVRCSPSEAVASIIGSKPWFHHPVQPDRVYAIVDWLQQLPAWKMNYRNTEEAVAMLDQILDQI